MVADIDYRSDGKVKRTLKIAHVKQRDDQSQGASYELHSLDQHLTKVATLAEQFANPFGGEDWARCAGIWHDLGKYSEEFQRYIKTASGYDSEAHMESDGNAQSSKVNHSDAGGQHAVDQFGVQGRILAYLIAGHHAGLPDWYKLDAPGGALQGRLENRESLSTVSTPTSVFELEMLQK